MIKKHYKIFKRIFDLFLSTICIIILLFPLSVLIWILKLFFRDNTPLFFTQQRYSKNGKIFKIIKYRSMTNDIPTRVGKFLREHSIDEIPQILNIFLGQMSFVGPRPYLLSEKEEVSSYFDDIVKVTPGLTGPYQIGGRHALSIGERALLEVEYAKQVNLKTDIIIFFKTFKVFFIAEE